jgi:phage-related protein
MPKYDGSIRINTKIETKDLNSQMMRVSNAIKKDSAALDSLNRKMEEFSQKKIPTEKFAELQRELEKAESEYSKLQARMSQKGAATSEYKALQKDLVAAQGELSKLVARQTDWENMGVPQTGGAWDVLNEQVAAASDRVDDLKEKLQQMENSGKAYTPKVDKAQLDEAAQKVDEIKEKINAEKASGNAFVSPKDTEEFQKMSVKASQLAGNIDVSKRRLAELNAKQKPIKKEFDRMKRSADKAFKTASSGAKKSAGLFGTFASRLKGIALSLLIFNWITKAFNTMVAGMQKGFSNLAKYSAPLANSFQSLKNSLATLGNAFAAAFAPIVQMVIPYLNALINGIARAITYVAQFIAILGGKSTFIRAKKIQDSYNDSLNGTAAAAKKAAGALAKFDDLDVLQKQDDSGGGGGGTQPKDMFEEVPVDSKLIDWLDGIKEKLSPILEYLEKMRDAFADGFFKALGDPTDRLETIRKGLEQIKTAMIDIWTDPDVLGAADRWVMSLVEMLGSFAGMIASVGLSLAAFFIGGFGQYLENDTDKIKQWLIQMFDIGTEINQLLENLFVGIAKVFEALASENGIRMATAMFGSFFSAMGGMSELAAKIGRDLLEVIVQPFTDNAGILEHAFEGLFGSTATYLEGLKQTFDDCFAYINRTYDKYVKPFVDSFANGISSIITNFMNAWEQYIQPTIDRIAEKMSSLMNDHFVPLVAVVSSVVGHITSLLQSTWETIIQPILDWIINYVGILLVEVFNLLVDILLQGVQLIIDGFTNFMAFLDTFVLRPWAEGWENAKEIFAFFWQSINELSEFLRKTLEQVFKIIRKLIDGDWKGAWNTAQEIFTIFKTKVEGVVDSIKAFLSGFFTWVSDMIAGVIEEIKNIGSGIKNAFTGGGSSKPRTMSTQPYAINESFASRILRDIPALASGSVIRGGNPFLAILGDQRAGQTNIEAPIGTIKQAVSEVMAESGGGFRTAKIVLQVNGVDLAQATLQDFLSEASRQGYDLEVIGG